MSSPMSCVYKGCTGHLSGSLALSHDDAIFMQMLIPLSLMVELDTTCYKIVGTFSFLWLYVELASGWV